LLLTRHSRHDRKENSAVRRVGTDVGGGGWCGVGGFGVAPPPHPPPLPVELLTPTDYEPFLSFCLWLRFRVHALLPCYDLRRPRWSFYRVGMGLNFSTARMCLRFLIDRTKSRGTLCMKRALLPYARAIVFKRDPKSEKKKKDNFRKNRTPPSLIAHPLLYETPWSTKGGLFFLLGCCLLGMHLPAYTHKRKNMW